MGVFRNMKARISQNAIIYWLENIFLKKKEEGGLITVLLTL